MNTAAVISGKYKFMAHENGEELLFDVSLAAPGQHDADKEFHETVNLIKQLPEKAVELRWRTGKTSCRFRTMKAATTTAWWTSWRGSGGFGSRWNSFSSSSETVERNSAFP